VITLNIRLTKEADALICVIYEKYLEKRANKVPKQNAKSFGDIHELHSDICSSWLKEDTIETCKELSNSGLLNIFYSDNIPYVITLEDEGLRYMENRFGDKAQRVLEYISTLKNILPF